MKRVLSVLFVLAAIVTLNLNSAAAKAPPKPPADCGKDVDKDGWCVKDTNRGDKLVGELDCDDNNKSVNPGATEVIDDGIDNDCDGSDLEAPKYAKAFGCTDAKCVDRLLKEKANCDADTVNCHFDSSTGRFLTEFGYYFIDTNCDGVRELLDQGDKDAYEEELREGSKRRCGSSGGGAKKAGTGATGAASSKPADPLFEDRLGKAETGLTELGGRTDKIGSDRTCGRTRRSRQGSRRRDRGAREKRQCSFEAYQRSQ